MPIYIYNCSKCHTTFELYFSTIGEAGRTSVLCTFCGSPDIKKQIVAPNFHLVGEGWAKDGYTYREKENLKNA